MREMPARLLISLIGLLSGLGSAAAEEPVPFKDKNLKAAVEHALWISDPTPTDMLALTVLYANERQIADLTGLEYAKNLQRLELAYNQLTGISPLAGMTNLKRLILNNNTIGSIAVVSGLTSLEYLDIHNNALTSISAVSPLSHLRTLVLRFNEIADLSPLSGLSDLEDADLRGNQIADLSGLAGLNRLRRLELHDNKISNLSPLSGLQTLETLVLQRNQISNISPLSTLHSLQALDLERNQISNISALSALTGLRNLSLYSNTISDISPLSALTSLRQLDLRNNPLNDEACDIYIPLIKAHNPGISFTYTTFCNGLVRLSSTAGGSIKSPGEGEFIYKRGATVLIEAQADPCFVFVNFSGSKFTHENPVRITITQDEEIRANFMSVLSTIHVDDDGPNDPRPGDGTISDPGENGTPEHPFDQIQEAISVAADGAVLFVHAGTYQEKIDLLGKEIEVTGFDAANANAAAWPVIDGGGVGPVVSFTHGEGPDCTLAGLVITGGKDRLVGGIRCVGSSPALVNCLIVGNRASDGNGSVISCTDSNAVFINCTIADNQAGAFGAALALHNSPVAVTNSILWGNAPKGILFDGVHPPVACYSVISGSWSGSGNLDADPLFAAAGRWVNRDKPAVIVKWSDPKAVWVMGDYHEQSQEGRWDAEAGTWQQDKANSPCVDHGDPATPVGLEPQPNGEIINIGAYGGTAEASKSRSSQ